MYYCNITGDIDNPVENISVKQYNLLKKENEKRIKEKELIDMQIAEKEAEMQYKDYQKDVEDGKIVRIKNFNGTGKTVSIELGREYKYKTLCVLIGQEPKTSNSKNFQLREWKKIFKYRRIGKTKYIIDKIYKNGRMLTTTERRKELGKECGLNYGAKGGIKDRKYDLYDSILEHYLSVEFKKNLDKTLSYHTVMNIVTKVTKIVNENFIQGRKMTDTIYNYLIETGEFKGNALRYKAYKKIIKQWSNKVSRTLKESVVQSSLKALERKKILDFYFNEYFLVYTNVQGGEDERTLATDEEIEMIKQAKRLALDKLGVKARKPKDDVLKSISQVYVDERKVDKFYNLVNDYIYELSDGLYCNCYSLIMIKMHNVGNILEQDELKKMTKDFNKIIQDRILLTTKDKSNKVRMELNKKLNKLLIDLDTQNVDFVHYKNQRKEKQNKRSSKII